MTCSAGWPWRPLGAATSACSASIAPIWGVSNSSPTGRSPATAPSPWPVPDASSSCAATRPPRSPPSDEPARAAADPPLSARPRGLPAAGRSGWLGFGADRACRGQDHGPPSRGAASLAAAAPGPHAACRSPRAPRQGLQRCLVSQCLRHHGWSPGGQSAGTGPTPRRAGAAASRPGAGASLAPWSAGAPQPCRQPGPGDPGGLGDAAAAPGALGRPGGSAAGGPGAAGVLAHGRWAPAGPKGGARWRPAGQRGGDPLLAAGLGCGGSGGPPDAGRDPGLRPRSSHR